jgi:L-amino acid N-acyltransferase YncA
LIRLATARDAKAIAQIYAPIVAGTAISFELAPPTEAEIAARIASTPVYAPWLVCARGDEVVGYAYAVYRSVGYKLGAWHDVGWWQLTLRDRVGEPAPPLSLADAQRRPEWEAGLAAGEALRSG